MERKTMDENNTQEQPAPTLVAVHGDSEEGSDLQEEPDQRRRDWDRTGPTHNECIRFIAMGVALLALLAGFLFYLFSRTVLPLLGAMVVAFVGYRCLDAWLDRTER